MKRPSLSLAADLYGCPNRCLHCWLGHMPNLPMEPEADAWIVERFKPYFDRIAFYSWLREPDYCPDYRARWERDKALSVNAVPERFELASFWRLTRDPDYAAFLKELGVQRVQLSFFGLEETTDRYVGRKGAFRELLRATEILLENGICPRWQGFINEENRMELVELLPYYLDLERIRSEAELCAAWKDEPSPVAFPLEEELVLYVSNRWELFFNYTHMRPEWVIGNLKTEPTEELMRRIEQGDTPALRAAREISLGELARRYGDPASLRVFSEGDYRIYLLNRHLEEMK